MRTRIEWVAEDDGTKKGYIGMGADVHCFTLEPREREGGYAPDWAIKTLLPGYGDERGPRALDSAKSICEDILVNFAVYTMNFFKEA